MPITDRPPIYVTEAELERLSDLAHAAQEREPAALTLIEELTRAHVAEADAFPADVVRMHDTVSFIYDGASYEGFTLVYPFEANIQSRRISVLTQVGAALIGLSPGQLMRWVASDGRSHELQVKSVSRG